MGTHTRIFFQKEKTKFVFMPCRTDICVSVLYSLIFHYLKDQNFSPISKHTENYFHFSGILYWHTFFSTILKLNERVIQCDKDIKKS